MNTTPKGGNAQTRADSRSTATKIRELNDEFRKNGQPENIYLSLAVVQIKEPLFKQLLEKIKSFSNFTPKNDPDGDHRTGGFKIGMHNVEWVIDYYDLDEDDESPDPSNASVTTRIMNVVLV